VPHRFVNVDQDLDLFNMAAFHEDLWFSGRNGVFRFAVTALKKAGRVQNISTKRLKGAFGLQISTVGYQVVMPYPARALKNVTHSVKKAF
jgi:hypothetical protein